MGSLLQVLALAAVCANVSPASVPSYKLTSPNNLDFLVLGDWGGLPIGPYSTIIERMIADGMNKVAMERNTSFQLAMGDNFYLTGVHSVDDPRFKQTFEDVFSGEALQTDWYAVAGNHDWVLSVAAQIEYTKHSKRWNFPDYYYTKTFNTPDGATVQVVMLDTIILCGQLWSDFSTVDDYDILDEKETEKAWLWAEQTLKASTADYLIVGGHYPVYSGAEHGPTKCLLDRLHPMLHEYGVSAYMCGHDHSLQHIKEVQTNSQIDYFLVGACNFASNSRAHVDVLPKGSMQFINGDNVGGFAHVSVNASSMSVTFISGENKELHQASLGPRASKFLSKYKN